MSVIRSGEGIAGCVPGPMAQGDCATIQGDVEIRELTIQEVENVDGAIAPVLFVGAVILSQVSWTNVAFYTGAMIGAGAYALVAQK